MKGGNRREETLFASHCRVLLVLLFNCFTPVWSEHYLHTRSHKLYRSPLEHITLNQRVLSEPANLLEPGAMDLPIVRPFYHRKTGLPAQRPYSCHAAKSKRHDNPYNVMPNRPMLQRKPLADFCVPFFSLHPTSITWEAFSTAAPVGSYPPHPRSCHSAPPSTDPAVAVSAPTRSLLHPP